MVEVTGDAQKELNEYFKDNEKGTIRIFLAPGGCSGPRLALALDEPSAEDEVEEAAGYKFCMGKDLKEKVKSVKIDLTPMGFIVVPEVPLPDTGGSGCGGCCGGCGG